MTRTVKRAADDGEMERLRVAWYRAAVRSSCRSPSRIACVAALSIALVATSAWSAEDEQARAREFYREGVRRYAVADYDLALAAFKSAWLTFESPAFLYNIAQCHRELGHINEELHFLEMYAQLSPEASDRADVEKRIAELRALPRTPPATAPPLVAPPASKPIEPPPPTTTPTVSAHDPIVAPEKPATPASSSHRGLLWGGLAAGVVVVAAIVLVAVLAQPQDAALPPSALAVHFP